MVFICSHISVMGQRVTSDSTLILHINSYYPDSLDLIIHNSPFIKAVWIIDSCSIPVALKKLKKIRKLDFINIDKFSIPEWINDTWNIHSIRFSGDNNLNFDSIFNELSKIDSLLDLKIHNNNMTSIPSSIKKMNKLKHLEIEVDSLVYISEHVTALQNLESISLRFRTLTNIEPIQRMISENTSLTYISIKRGDLQNGIDFICNLKKLEVLQLGHCNIDEVPECIGDINTLKWLYLSDNNIYFLPKSMKQLENLFIIILYNNEITDEELQLMKSHVQPHVKFRVGKYYYGEKIIIQDEE